MDGHRFDALTRSVFASASRRGALRLIVGATAGGVLAAVGRTPASAACGLVDERCTTADDCCANARCIEGRCSCPPRFTVCEGRCRDLQVSPNHCGACGNACEGDTPCCIGGRCRRTCGGECCANCFLETDPNTGRRSEFCCPRSLLCRSPRGPEHDRCCYPDEECRDGTCCRTCPEDPRAVDGCCDPVGTEVCRNGRCRSLDTARLIRVRR